MLVLRFAQTLLGAGTLVLVVAAVSGCTTEASCFQDCTDQAPITNGGSAGKSGVDIGGSFMLGMGGDDGTGNKPGGGGAGQLEDAGTECDTADLQNDVDNCGVCGNHCLITGAESACVKGKCVLDHCLDERFDLNGNPEDGCELACDGDPMDDEVCNGEDDNCDGQRDEGFDLQTDVDNCGACTVKCDLPHASAKCEAGECKIDACEPGFFKIDNDDSSGCTYPCHYKDKLGNDCDLPAAGQPNPDGCGVEVCDDKDQDCDGDFGDVVDENFPCSQFCPGGNCVGECTPGVTQCIGSELVCIPGKTPSAETCDGLDNNCDGKVDEDYDLNTNTENCGKCGDSCIGKLPHAFAKCVAKQCVIDQCESDYGELDSGAPGCEQCPVLPARPESCNGKDDDCNGLVDDNPIPAPAGFCKQRVGTLCNNISVTCAADGSGWRCNYPAGVETTADGKVVVTESLCDGIDGNCDTQSDEAFLDLNKACNDGDAGICLDFGTIKCDAVDKTKTVCKLATNTPKKSAEDCNGLDDDCDGTIDEGTDEMVRVTRNGLDFWIDMYEASRPDATDTSAGTDETHLCGVPDRLPWTGASFDEASEACIASGKRLCHINELEEACEGAANKTYPYGNAYVGGSCNGIDASGSAAAPTGSFVSCVSDDGVFDLSGNVAEWSDDVQGATTGTPTYDIMSLHGGSFLTPANGLTCKFDFDVISTNAVLPSLGFRCCKNP
jgi:hypothetical protein